MYFRMRGIPSMRLGTISSCWSPCERGWLPPRTLPVTFGLGRVKRRLHSLSRILVDSQELDPGVSRDVLVAYLRVTSSQDSEETVVSSVN